MDFKQLEGYLQAASRVSPLVFEIWDTTGAVFSANEPEKRGAQIEALTELNSKIYDTGVFQAGDNDNGIAMYGVPLMHYDDVCGTLIAYCSVSDLGSGNRALPSGGKILTEDIEFFLNNMSSVVESKWASQQETEEMANELSRYFEDLHIYSRMASQIKTLKVSRGMLKDLISEVLQTVRVDFAFSFIPGRGEHNQEIIKKEALDKITAPMTFIRNLIKSIPKDASTLEEKYFIINDSNDSPGFKQLHPDTYRFLAVMIQYESTFYGWLGLVSFNMDEMFRRGELRLLISVAEQLAMVMANSDLYRDLEMFVINMVKSMVSAIEAKDKYTRGHSERVNRICMLIADELGLDDDTKQELNWASVLHDVGKIGIPESVLNKPDRLTAEEFEVIKKHPEKGEGILDPIMQLKKSIPGIVHHHERYDGKGYPDGLKGKEIPLIARIIAVADTFDAITSDRAYREGMPPHVGFEILNQVSGEQLDPELVDTFNAVYEKKALSN